MDWKARAWRLLGRRGLQTGTLQIADFRRARGVYVLYGDTGIYYVGLASGAGGIGERLKAHLTDWHDAGWSRFSWFAFDSPSETDTYPDGVLRHEEWNSVEGEDKVMIQEMEALLVAVTSPPGNVQRPRFGYGTEWFQVADHAPEVKVFADLRGRITPPG